MINWYTQNLELTRESKLVRMRIGEPTLQFWVEWKRNKRKIMNTGLTVYTVIHNNKKKWLVKRMVEVIADANDIEHGKDIPDGRLFDYQLPHFNNLIKAFAHGNGVVDASDTGTGKTPVACALADYFKLRPVVICTLRGISVWMRWAKRFKIHPIFIANYEEFKGTGNKYGKLDTRYYPHRIMNVFGPEYGLENKVEKDICFNTWKACIYYLKVNVHPKIENIIDYYDRNEEKLFPRNKCRDVNNFYWSLPDNVLIIFDEAHKCKGLHTQNAKMLAATKKHRVLLCTATLAETPRDMKAIGYILNLHNHYNFNSWCKSKLCIQDRWHKWECVDPIEAMKSVSRQLFPKHGSRMRIVDIPDFPETQIVAESYNSDIKEKFNKCYRDMIHRVEELNKAGAEEVLKITEILRYRQATELMKVPLFANMAKDAVESRCSVALFVNFIATREMLQRILNTKCSIYGVDSKGHKQSREEQDYYIERFQLGEERYIVNMAQAGSETISLHDVYGNFQRMSIISPMYSSRIFKQTLGRVHRAEAKSKSLQRVVFLDGTIEQEVCESVNKKLDNINALNDGDLMESDLLKFNLNLKGVAI